MDEISIQASDEAIVFLPVFPSLMQAFGNARTMPMFARQPNGVQSQRNLLHDQNAERF